MSCSWARESECRLFRKRKNTLPHATVAYITCTLRGCACASVCRPEQQSYPTFFQVFKRTFRKRVLQFVPTLFCLLPDSSILYASHRIFRMVFFLSSYCNLIHTRLPSFIMLISVTLSIWLNHRILLLLPYQFSGPLYNYASLHLFFLYIHSYFPFPSSRWIFISTTHTQSGPLVSGWSYKFWFYISEHLFCFLSKPFIIPLHLLDLVNLAEISSLLSHFLVNIAPSIILKHVRIILPVLL